MPIAKKSERRRKRRKQLELKDDGNVIYVGADGKTFTSDPLTSDYAEWDDVVSPPHVAATVARIRAATGYAGPASLLVDSVKGTRECHKLVRRWVNGL